ncbi:cadherin repeat domain-containing protein, partial [Hyphomonas sp.]|uniref:cadherin repeat domain-containing protein n=1 Tax=Hyphomonas sp. TaxID=87 RepID=UPI00391A2850
MRPPTHALSAWNVVLLAALFVLVACGGSSGGGSPAPPPPAANWPPVITSPASVTVNEQTTGPVYTLTATDPDGDPITLSLVPGGDAAVFSFAPATGVLSLPQPLDFNAPQDADGNNVYRVTFEARDGRGGVASLTVEITVLQVEVG